MISASGMEIPAKVSNLKKGLGLAVLVIVFDQISKWWIITSVMNPPRVIEVLPFFNLVLAFNQGVSFGLFDTGAGTGQWLLAGIAIAISIGLGVWLARAAHVTVVVALGLIIGGAMGNVVDRFAVGAVVDFLDFHAFDHHWPAFNVADTGITIGAAILILESFFNRKTTHSLLKNHRV